MKRRILVISCFVMLYFISISEVKVCENLDWNPDSLFKVDSLTIQKNDRELLSPYKLDSIKDHYFAKYEIVLLSKNRKTRFEYLRNNLKESYEILTLLSEELSSNNTFFRHQRNRIPAYVEYDIYTINHSTRLPVFTKKTRSERWEFIDELKENIKERGNKKGLSKKQMEEFFSIAEKLNEQIVDDYVLYVTRKYFKKLFINNTPIIL